MQSSLKDLNLNPRSAHNLNSTRNMSPVGYVLAFLIFFFFFLSTSLSLVRNVGCHTWVRHSSCKSSAAHFCQCVQEQCCPFLSVCARAVLPISVSVCNISVYPDNGTAAVLGIFNVHTDFNPRNCAWELYRHCKRGCTRS